MAFSLNPFRLKLPVKLVLIIAGILLFGNYISLGVKEFVYAISLSLKSILEFLLPFIIFSYLSSCILSFKKGVLTFVIILLSTVFISNFIATLAGYGSCLVLLEKINTATNVGPSETCEVLVPTWTLNLKKIISNDYALYAGLLCGLLFSFMRSIGTVREIKSMVVISKKFEDFADMLKKASTFFLIRIFIPLVPLFILGFIVNLKHEGTLGQIVTSYAPIFIFTVSIQILYCSLLFAIASKFNFNRWYTYIRNAVPAVIAGFSTMSSAAAMPLTLLGAEKNTENPNMARILIPATVNIHMIGNAITISIMAMSFLLTFGIAYPSLQTFVLFGMSFALSQFAVAAVPGGGILVMLPLLQQYMGFTAEMTSIITALYILFDAPLTASNIMGNSVFAIFLNKIFTKLGIGTD